MALKKVQIKNMYNIYRFIKEYVKFRQARTILKDDYANSDLVSVLDNWFGTQFSTDHAGRLYSVVNPTVEHAINTGDMNVPFEYDKNGKINTFAFVRTWFKQRMSLLNVELFNDKQAFFDFCELNTIEITHVGPDEYDNFLIKIVPLHFGKMDRYKKYALAECTVLAAAVAVLFKLI